MCGIVINADASYVIWDNGWNEEEGCYVDGEWDGDGYVDFIKCPVCQEKILKE